MKKYLKIYKVLIANSFSYEAQYRSDTWLKMLFNALYMGIMLFTIEIIFSHTNSILGWGKEQLYLMTMFWILIDELGIMIFAVNLEDLPNLITDGKLDAHLTKPVSTLFAVSTKFFLVRSLYRFIMELAVLAVVIWKFDFSVNLAYLPLALLLGLAGLLLMYSVTLIINTFGFWFMRIDNINELARIFSNMGRYPLDVFPKTMRVIALTAIPIAFTAYVPIAALTGRAEWYIVVYAFAFAGLLFWSAVKFWNFSLKRYSSASS